MSEQDDRLVLLERLQDALKDKDEVSSRDISALLGWEHDRLVGVMKSIESMGKIATSRFVRVLLNLTEEGQEIAESGSPEYRVLQLLMEKKSLPADDLKKEPWMKFGLNILLKNKVAVSDKGTIRLADGAEGKCAEDETRETLTRVRKAAETGLNGEESFQNADISSLVKRKLIVKANQTVFNISKTQDFSVTIVQYDTDLTRDMLRTEAWKTARFKPYNWNASGVPPSKGSIHPLIQTMNEFRNILIQMGFEEMPTQRWVESSFWNFDALYQPQTHPVRDAHDTFYLSDPVSHPLPPFEGPRGCAVNKLDRALMGTPQQSSGADPGNEKPYTGPEMESQYFEKVWGMHEFGDDAATGWQCEWKPEEACKLVLRTHTTAISSAILHHLGKIYKETGKLERKWFFSIDRVFRNEDLDATHLAEFHQVEGVVVDKDASLAMLMGVIESFFRLVGITELKFKPAYNPYTEPSMEIFGFHPILNKWTEIGNSGLFRPEMLKPMGLPEGLNVLGWGLSLERPTMISRGLKDIRELFGPRAKLSVF